MKKSNNSFKSVLNAIGDWVGEHTFWAETIRTIILGTLGAYLVATIIEKVKDDVAYLAEIDKARLSAKINAIKDFGDKSYQFTLASVRFKEDSISFNQLRDFYDNFRIAKHQLSFITNNNKKIFDSTEAISNLMLLLLNRKDSLKCTCLPNSTGLSSPQDAFEEVRQLIKHKSDMIEKFALDSLLQKNM